MHFLPDIRWILNILKNWNTNARKLDARNCAQVKSLALETLDNILFQELTPASLFQCLECLNTYSEDELTNHLLNPGGQLKSSLHCDICGKYSPSKCSFSAHRRKTIIQISKYFFLSLPIMDDILKTTVQNLFSLGPN